MEGKPGLHKIQEGGIGSKPSVSSMPWLAGLSVKLGRLFKPPMVARPGSLRRVGRADGSMEYHLQIVSMDGWSAKMALFCARQMAVRIGWSRSAASRAICSESKP